MIDPNFAFSAAGTAALLGWAALLVSLFVGAIRERVWLVTGWLIPAAIGIAYMILIAAGIGHVGGTDFGSIAEVRRVFADDSALAAGWLHYLAFDMVVGTLIARDGTAHRIPALLLMPALVLTFLFGPAGLVLHLLLRLAFRGRQPAEVTA